MKKLLFFVIYLLLKFHGTSQKRTEGCLKGFCDLEIGDAMKESRIGIEPACTEISKQKCRTILRRLVCTSWKEKMCEQ